MSREREEKPQMGRIYLQKTHLLSKEFLTHSKKTKPIKKWTKDLNRHLNKEDVQMANKFMKIYSASYVMREIQIKTMMRYHFTSITMAKIQNTETTC